MSSVTSSRSRREVEGVSVGLSGRDPGEVGSRPEEERVVRDWSLRGEDGELRLRPRPLFGSLAVLIFA